MVNIKTFLNRAEAEIAKQYLDVKGIPSQINADDCSGMEQNLNLVKGIRPMVSSEHLGRAQRLLQEMGQENAGMTAQEKDEWKRYAASKHASPLTASISACIAGCCLSAIGICFYLFADHDPSVKSWQVAKIAGLLVFLLLGVGFILGGVHSYIQSFRNKSKCNE